MCGSQLVTTLLQGLATPQLPGGVPLQTVDHFSGGIVGASPTWARHRHEHGSRYSLQSSSMAHGPDGGGSTVDFGRWIVGAASPASVAAVVFLLQGPTRATTSVVPRTARSDMAPWYATPWSLAQRRRARAFVACRTIALVRIRFDGQRIRARRLTFLVWLGLPFVSSCGATVRAVTDGPLPPPPAPIATSGIVVYSDIEGHHMPPRVPRPKVGERVIVSFVACERHSENYGPATWSCRADDDAALAPDEARTLERASACFAVERRPATRAIVAGLGADRPALPPTPETLFVFVRRTQVNRSKEVKPIGCESAGDHPCDPVGAQATGRTHETVNRSHAVWIGGEGVPTTTRWLEKWPLPPWAAPLTYAKLTTLDPPFAPGAELDDADARAWLARLTAVDASNAPRVTRLALAWDRAILAFKLGDRARGLEALAAAEKELAPETQREPIDRQIAYEAATLHAIADGTLTQKDPCRRQ